MRFSSLLLAGTLLGTPALWAQKYDFFVSGGGSFAGSKTISNPAGSLDAGFKNGFSAGVSLGQNLYKYIGGELRYTYQRQDMKLTGSGVNVAFAGESHAVHYDLLIHAAPTGAKVRPYVAAGGGMKYYRGTGDEIPFQPGSDIAVLTKTNQVTGLVSVGGGVKFAISKKIEFRIDVRDYLTPFPKEVIAPAPNSNVSGWINNIVPTAGISFVF